MVTKIKQKIFKFQKRKFSKLSIKEKRSTWRMFIDFINDYFSTSSIHGFYHISVCGRHPVETILWISIVLAAIFGASQVSLATMTRYTQNPTVISMERDRFSWNTSFPAATICPSFKFDEEKLDAFVEKSSAKNKTYLRMFLQSLAEATYNNLEDVLPYDEIPASEFLNILLEIQFNFKPSVTNSGLTGTQYTLTQVVSEMGFCYSFNSELAIYNSPGFWKSGEWKVLPVNEIFNVNPLDGEVFANVINMSTGFEVYIHGPNEVADIASKKIVSQNGYFLQIYLSGLTIFSSQSTRELTINQRKCRFYYESNLRHSPVYSYVLCRSQCRINMAQRLCGCIPHFYRPLDGEKVCNVSGLHCLSKYKEQLILIQGNCQCIANCDEVNYIVEEVDTREWFLGSNLQWGLKEYPKMRLKRNVIFGFSDFLVYIGGMVGLFLGCSVLSLIEIVYFYTLRLYWYIVKYNYRTRI